jgi:hypothetical protein
MIISYNFPIAFSLKNSCLIKFVESGILGWILANSEYSKFTRNSFQVLMSHMLSCQNKTRNWIRAFWTIRDSEPILGFTKIAQFQWTFVYLLSSQSPTYLLTRNIRIFSSSPPLLSTNKALRYPIPHPKSNRFEELKVGIWISVPTKPNCDPPWVHQVDCYSWIFFLETLGVLGFLEAFGWWICFGKVHEGLEVNLKA